MNPTPIFNPVFEALDNRAFFKLICGGSFSELGRLEQLIGVYGQTASQMVDVSADLHVVETAVRALSQLEKPPLLMVSFPLDDDPHFRKIELEADTCTSCGLCIPVCPTEVFSESVEAPLNVETPLCYGCGRCVPVCPVDALKLDAFSVHPHLAEVLAKPEVHAVEIHTTYADPAMIDPLYDDLGDLLRNKLIAVCLRPHTLPTEQVLEFLNKMREKTPFPLIVQVDGVPMSGSDDPVASIPALKAARDFASLLPENCYLTISGGINAYTARYLAQPEYAAIQGVGMGTAARKAIWNEQCHADRILLAKALVSRFYRHSGS